MSPGLRDTLLDILARRLDGVVSGTELVDWAVRALQEGIEAESVVYLAGLSRDSSAAESESLFDRGLTELGLKVPAPADLRRAYVGVVSRAFLEGNLGAQDALDRVHRNAVTPLGHPPDLSSWCFVWEGLGPDDYRTLEENETAEEARRLALLWASHLPPELEVLNQGER